MWYGIGSSHLLTVSASHELITYRDFPCAQIVYERTLIWAFCTRLHFQQVTLESKSMPQPLRLFFFSLKYTSCKPPCCLMNWAHKLVAETSHKTSYEFIRLQIHITSCMHPYSHKNWKKDQANFMAIIYINWSSLRSITSLLTWYQGKSHQRNWYNCYIYSDIMLILLKYIPSGCTSYNNYVFYPGAQCKQGEEKRKMWHKASIESLGISKNNYNTHISNILPVITTKFWHNSCVHVACIYKEVYVFLGYSVFVTSE